MSTPSISFLKSKLQKVPLLARYLAAFVVLLAVAGGLWVSARAFAIHQNWLHIGSSVNAFNGNDFATALAQADAVLAKDPKNVDALLVKATILAQEGSLTFTENTYAPQAIALAQQALAIDPTRPDAWRIIGYAYEIMQQYPEAHDAYAKSLALDPYNAMTISQNAHAFDLQGDSVQAEAGYRKALTLSPTLDQANMGMGRVLIAQRKPQEALNYFTNAYRYSQNTRLRAEASYSAGIANAMLNNNDAIEPLMAQATTIDPNYPLGWVGLGTILFDQSISTSTNLSGAQRNALAGRSFDDLHTAFALYPNQSAAIEQAGLELLVFGKKQQGIQMLQEALKSIPLDITLTATEKATSLLRVKALIAAAQAHK